MEIRAKGKKFGRTLEVIVTDGNMKFNGKHDKVLKHELNGLLALKPVFAGTYAPEEDDDPINVLNILSNYFFDDIPEITTKDVAPMPAEEGVIY